MASWDKLPKEPQKAFSYFVAYRDMGPDRSLPRVAQTCAVSVSRLKDLSLEYNWVARCDQWDAHLDAVARKAYVTELERQARQRAQGHSALFGKALQLLAKVDAAKLGEISAAMKVATDAMRLEADLATAKTEIDVRDVTPEEARRELAELVRSRLAGADRPDAGRGTAARAGDDRGGVPAVH